MDDVSYAADIEDAELGAQWALASPAAILPPVFYPTVLPSSGGTWLDPIPNGNAAQSSNGWSVEGFLSGLRSATSTVTDLAKTAYGIQTARDEFSLKRLTSQAQLDLSKAQVSAQRDVGLANAGVQSYQAKLAAEQARQVFDRAVDLGQLQTRIAAMPWTTYIGLALAGAGVWFAWKAYKGKRK